MHLLREICIEISIDELSQVPYVPIVQLYHLVSLTQNALGIFLGVAIQEDVVAALRIFVVVIIEIRMDSNLLLSAVAAHRPKTVIIAGRARPIVIFLLRLLVKLVLPAPDDVLERIHGSEIEIVLVCPRISRNFVLLHARTSVLIVTGDSEGVLVDPLGQQFVIRLGDDQIVFIGSEIHALGVCLLVVDPLKWLAVMRVEKHQHSRELTVPVENVLRGVSGDVDHPI